MRATITGDKRLDRKLKKLAGPIANRAITAGIRAGMTPVARAMRAAVNASPASATAKRGARKAIGQRFSKNKGGPNKGVREAKVGFGVGRKGARRLEHLSSGETRGVGISATNIHWFVLGTDERETKAGHGTGSIPELFAGAADAGRAVGSAALAAARKKITQVIEREARKR